MALEVLLIYCDVDTAWKKRKRIFRSKLEKEANLIYDLDQISLPAFATKLELWRLEKILTVQMRLT